MDEIVREFLVEAHEYLDKLDQDLVQLEQQPKDDELVGGIFRSLHSIKGCCGYLGFDKLEAVTHAGENLLGCVRDHTLAVDKGIVDVLLKVNDAIRFLLDRIENTGGEGDQSFTALISQIHALQGKTAAVEEPPAEAPEPSPERASEPASERTSVAQRNIRIDVGLIDELMNLVGELVLSRNQLIQHTGRLEDGSLQRTGQRLSHITTELQARIMKTRMQPIGNVWHKLPRLIRDTAVVCGKQVTVAMEGQETELDRTILDAIKDPLTHIVRNAIDHGIESPEVRSAAGKSATGRLTLRSFHEGGQVNIEIADDGGGVNVDRVRERARERGIVAPDVLVRMSDRDITQLVFHPGFSTAEQVTSVSGRGVGMDVVKTNIEKIGGQVEIDSTMGKGTVVKIRIPLTLAIIPALIVICGGQRFALPQVCLDELVRLEGEAAKKGIERVRGIPVYRLRGKLLPIVYLREALELAPREGREGDDLQLVVLQGGEQQFGLVVDDILDTEEIVVKPLSSWLKRLSIYAGSTIMGDGRVALILDALGLAARAGLRTRSTARVLAQLSDNSTGAGSEEQVFLLLRIGTRRFAMPLEAVSRLEAFTPQAIEHVSGGDVVQYRGGILPIVMLSDLLGVFSEADPATRRVVVRERPGGSVGLMVDEIVDIIAERLTIHPIQGEPLVSGYAVIQGQVTELLNIEEILVQAAPPLLGNAA